jgi:HSP20 family molecular chaperone IbpA
VIQADLAGYSAEEIDVRSTERSVTISTQRAVERCVPENGLPPAAEAGCHRRIRLPRPVRPDAATVRYFNGKLTIELPRSEPAVSLRALPGGQTLGQPEIPLRTAADVMPPSPGPHEGVYRP